jgi:predicted nicotinamide N-methyase
LRPGNKLEAIQMEPIDIETLSRNIQRILPHARVTPTRLSLCPEIELLLLDPINMHRRFSPEEVRMILSDPPFWALCWASGQAMACHILQNPSLVKGKRVLDFGSGSGVAGLAAGMAGALKVLACDLDDDALDATRANAVLNKIPVHTYRCIEEISEDLDLILAADVLYDSENHHFLEAFLDLAPAVLVADSRLKAIPVPAYRKIREITLWTMPDLHESDEFNRVNIYLASSASLLSRPGHALP